MIKQLSTHAGQMLIVFLIALYSSHGYTQNCSTAVVPPAVVNGVSVTATSTGVVATYPSAFTSCGIYTTPANSLHLGSSGAFTYTFLFSAPVNNVVFLVTATGNTGNEEFTFTTNNGAPNIIDLGSCNTTIVGNTMFSGAGSGPTGGGGIFEIDDPAGSFTSLTISGPGGLAGSLFGLCESSVAPTPSGITSTDVTCFGDCDGSATVNPGNMPPYTYQWDANAGGGASATASNLCAGTYSVQVTDGTGTTDVLQVTINEPSAIQPSVASQSDVSCFNGTDGSVTVSATGGTGNMSYDIGSGSGASGTFNNLSAGSYTVTATDASGCSADVTFSINEPSELVLNQVYTVDPPCSGAPDGEISVQGAGGTGNYTYTLNGGPNSASGLFTGLSAGVYACEVTDDNGCQAALSITLSAAASMQVTETVVDETCAGDCDGSIQLDVTQGSAPFTYSIDDCVTSGSSDLFTDLCPGQYDICITDDNGCSYTSTVNISTANPSVDASITSISDLCLNDGAVNIQTANAGVLSGNTGITGSTFNPQLAGEGTHQIINTISGTCPDADTIEVTVLPLPVVSFIADNTEGCVDLDVNFTSTGDAGVLYQWNFGDGFISTSNSTTSFTYDQSGTFDVTLVVTDANGCTNEATYTDYIHTEAAPTANFTFTPQHPDAMDPEITFNDGSLNADSWYWQFDQFDNSTEQNPTYIFPGLSGTYGVTLYVTSVYGCTDSITKTISIDQGQLLYVPNTFTPNGDEHNQMFRVVTNGIDTYEYHMVIYNRWGELIFESNDPNMGWDGTYRGLGVQDGTYSWHITLDDLNTAERQEFHGHVHLLR